MVPSNACLSTKGAPQHSAPLSEGTRVGENVFCHVRAMSFLESLITPCEVHVYHVEVHCHNHLLVSEFRQQSLLMSLSDSVCDSGDVLAWLSVWSQVQMICTWSS